MLGELRKGIILICSDHRENLDTAEMARLNETKEILAYLGLSKVSVLKGGVKNYKLKVNNPTLCN